MTENKYKLMRDGDGWGVIDKDNIYINDEPMTKEDAKEMLREMLKPEPSRYADENPALDGDYWGNYD